MIPTISRVSCTVSLREAVSSLVLNITSHGKALSSLEGIYVKQSLCIRQTSYSYVRLNLRATLKCAAKLGPPCILATVLR